MECDTASSLRLLLLACAGEAALLFTPGERDLLFVCFNNHVPNARRMAPGAEVRPGGGSALDAARAEVAARVAVGQGANLELAASLRSC